ncbi:MAG: Wzz/FepE/Etk N-terminal domain-containing protein, partial [Saprospiraceae bacterium]
MNNSNNLPNFNQANADQDSLSLPQIIQIVRRNWAIFAICIFLSGFFAYLFLRYARPVYMSKASVLIKTSQGAESNIQESIVKEIGLGGSNKMLENEVQIFKSRTLMEHAVRSLGMEVSMESEGRVKNSQFFNLSSPVQIDTYSISPKALPANFRLEIKDSSNFTLSNDTKSVEGKFGQLTRIDSFSFVANYVNPIEEMPFTILLHFNTVNVIAERLSNKLKVVSDIEKGNVLELGLEDEVPSRANALLDSLITFYNKLGIEESNQVALNTIDFIDDRLQYISGELTDVEGGLQSFKEK